MFRRSWNTSILPQLDRCLDVHWTQMPGAWTTGCHPNAAWASDALTYQATPGNNLWEQPDSSAQALIHSAWSCGATGRVGFVESGLRRLSLLGFLWAHSCAPSCPLALPGDSWGNQEIRRKLPGDCGQNPDIIAGDFSFGNLAW